MSAQLRPLLRKPFARLGFCREETQQWALRAQYLNGAENEHQRRPRKDAATDGRDRHRSGPLFRPIHHGPPGFAAGWPSVAHIEQDEQVSMPSINLLVKRYKGLGLFAVKRAMVLNVQQVIFNGITMGSGPK